MNKVLAAFLTAFTLLFIGSRAQAFDVPAKPDNGYYIRDTANKLSYSDTYSLNQRIEAFNKTTRNEIGVLIIPTLAGDSVEDAAYDVFNSWHIGKAGLDNGILIMIAANDHKLRIETGKGAEGDIPDAKTNEIITTMKPYLRKNDFAGAVGSAVENITTIMEDRTGQKPIVNSTQPNAVHSSDTNDGIVGAYVVFGFLGLIGLISLGIYLFDRARRKKEAAIYRQSVYPDIAKDNHFPVDDHYFPAALPIPTKTSTHKMKPTHRSNSESSSSYSSSSSSSDSGSSYSSGSDSGSGFGGGDSGGGGSSGDW
jgi:uncharacterized protein